MGYFDCVCEESGLVLDHRLQTIPIIETASGEWAAIALPIAGTYDGSGTMEVPKQLDANMRAILAFGKTLTYVGLDAAKIDLQDMLDEIRGDGNGAETSDDKRVSFALVDDGIYRAIVAAVAENGATAWTRYAQLGLQIPELPLPGHQETQTEPPAVDPTTKRLCEAILAAPNDDGPRKVYIDHLLERDDPRGKLLSIIPALNALSFDAIAALVLPNSTIYGDREKASLRDAIVEYALFAAWGTRLSRTCGENEFLGYADDPEIGGGTEAHCKRARKKYAGMPELLAAVEANERAWRRRGREDEVD